MDLLLEFLRANRMQPRVAIVSDPIGVWEPLTRWKQSASPLAVIRLSGVQKGAANQLKKCEKPLL